ncbi:MAG: hypothetical protein XU15_C0012G0034 [candidate division NC10 bacterium CSP1-5]|nr:MAG: hypothetical protein XU15_C0012G0034 [candidate division NC10 bacterium CSP1-5]
MQPRSSDRPALAQIQAEVIHCTRCPRLTRHREQVAAQKVRRLTRPMFHAIFKKARRLLSEKENPA